MTNLRSELGELSRIRAILAAHDDGEELRMHDGNLVEAVQCIVDEVKTLRQAVKIGD